MDTSEHMDLFTLQSVIKDAVGNAFHGSVWVRAEISSISLKGGHCYMDLCQNEKGSIIAKTKAIIWKTKYPSISSYFTFETGNELAPGIEVLVRVTPSFHELYGLSLVIDDIDPQFTLGEKALQKKKTIEELEKQGLMDRQKKLSLPAVPKRFAIISSVDAAGYGDFMRHIGSNPYGYRFETDLFEATVQGYTAPDSICAALASVAASTKEYDAVLIIRGGGSELDLACFDDYRIAASIAMCPLPVLTAIGHDRDFHVADMVANIYVKTPTALADFFISRLAEQDSLITSFENRLALAFQGRLSSMASAVDTLDRRIRHGVEIALEKNFSRVAEMDNRISSRLKWRIDKDIALVANQLKFILSIASGRLSAEESRLQFFEMKIAVTDPRNVLDKGIPLVLDSNGVKFDSVIGRKPGDAISIMMPDGKIDAIVTKVADTKDKTNTKTA